MGEARKGDEVADYDHLPSLAELRQTHVPLVSRGSYLEYLYIHVHQKH